MKKLLFACALAAGSAWASDTSEAIGVFTDPDTTSFWRTAVSSTFSFDLDYPEGATSVSIDVRGAKYHRLWEGVTDASWTLNLPVATESENVYALTLTFDDGTVKSGSFAVIASQTAGNEIVATFGKSVGTGEIGAKSVLPVPYGTTALTVDGDPVVSGSTGPQGWFVCGKMARGEHAFCLTADQDYEAALTFVAPGALLFLR